MSYTCPVADWVNPTLKSFFSNTSPLISFPRRITSTSPLITFPRRSIVICTSYTIRHNANHKKDTTLEGQTCCQFSFSRTNPPAWTSKTMVCARFRVWRHIHVVVSKLLLARSNAIFVTQLPPTTSGPDLPSIGVLQSFNLEACIADPNWISVLDAFKGHSYDALWGTGGSILPTLEDMSYSL